MSRIKLSDDVVVARMVELRNLRRLHAHDRKQIVALKAEIRQLKQEKADDRAYFEALIAKQAIQIAELQTMVFGRKKRPPTGGTPVLPAMSSVSKPARSKDSYRRPTPPASAMTTEVVIPLPAHCACGGSFESGTISTHERYEEDVPLPELTPEYTPHLVTKYLIERGECLACGKATSGKDLGGQAVTLGPNVRLLVAHLVSVVGLSYAQTTTLLLSLYGLVISKAEIAGILQNKHEAWLPTYNQLKADIRAAPVVHVDETPWKIQQEGGGYAWVLADAGSPKVCYELTTSRGAPHAQRLFGQDTDQPFVGVRVSDDYGPYRNPKLPGIQQLCWAHLYRCIRDIRHNANLPDTQLPYVRHWYERFAAVYQDLRLYLSEPYDEVVRNTQADELWHRVQGLADEPATAIAGEPEKLTRLKAQLQRAGTDRLFVCLTKNTPCDNNRAERDLRQLVLKRRRSFGSQTEKGAKALATVLSVCTTTWRIQPQGYFQQLALLG